MADFKYSLSPYRGKQSRLTCPACERPHCFSPYVDEAGEILHPTVGRCDHESSCGYHKTPAEYFQEHPEERQPDWRYERQPWQPAGHDSRHARLDRASPCIAPYGASADPDTPDTVYPRKTRSCRPHRGLRPPISFNNPYKNP